METPRGIRNHNPANIDRPADKWQGMAEDQASDSRFVIFVAPQWGIRALVKVLLSYQRKHGIKTIRGIINRWPPSREQHRRLCQPGGQGLSHDHSDARA